MKEDELDQNQFFSEIEIFRSLRNGGHLDFAQNLCTSAYNMTTSSHWISGLERATEVSNERGQMGPDQDFLGNRKFCSFQNGRHLDFVQNSHISTNYMTTLSHWISGLERVTETCEVSDSWKSEIFLCCDMAAILILLKICT